MPTFIAVNMEDFHANQHPGEASTVCKMLFIGARNKEAAGMIAMSWHPKVAWAIIPKTSFDRHIVYGEGEEK